jgi:integrase
VAERLTLKKVAALLRRGAPGKFLDERNLYLVVRSKTAAHWECRYQVAGVKRYLGLGSALNFDLLEARKRAREVRQQLDDGIDPAAERRMSRARSIAALARLKTFSRVCDEYYDAHADKWSPKSRADFMQKMRDHCHPTLGTVPVAMIDKALVLSVLQPIWKTMPPTAGRVQRHMANVLNFAGAAGYRQGENPARWSGHLEHLLAAQRTTIEHHAALPYKELPAYMTMLRALPGMGARALELAILCGARTAEVVESTWDEMHLDDEQPTWIVPAPRMKSRKAHHVPLSRQAVALLRSLPTDGGAFVFMGSKAGRPVGKDALNKANKTLRNDVAVHGFRSTLRTWIEEQTSFPQIIAEHVLAHSVGTGVERAYRRTTLPEQRARLMQMFADFAESTPTEGDVVPLRARS